ncbi:MAG: thiamine-phosphate pyrophosphorylase [Pelagibacterales bacterium]|nr:thiamine-phosphate pyrophosphorylase [Pelagibacterales bacterium]
MKRFVYLISPSKIYLDFYEDLEKVLSFKKVSFFQLRLKKTPKNLIIKIAKKIKTITKKNKVKFIINDDSKLAKEVNADGCHIGQFDSTVSLARKDIKKKIVGVTCHNSKDLALKASRDKADYLAFGSFFKSKLKPNAKKADLKILLWSKKNIKKPIVVIGGITDKNYKELIKAGANYIAISTFIWNNPFLKPEAAIKKFK